MFNDYKPKNRRLTPKEQEDDLWLARIFKRPVRTMLLDPPFYPWIPKQPYSVNFDLGFNKGLH